jgi:hypothetical protein
MIDRKSYRRLLLPWAATVGMALAGCTPNSSSSDNVDRAHTDPNVVGSENPGIANPTAPGGVDSTRGGVGGGAGGGR